MKLGLVSLLAGLILACAFPPTDCKWAIWVGLVPLLWAVVSSRQSKHAFVLGAIAGLTFFLLTLHPLVSAAAWSGWSHDTSAIFADRMSRQAWFTHSLWLCAAVLGAFIWGVWAAITERLSRANPGLLYMVAPSAWVLWGEWIRTLVTFDFAFSLLGNATADMANIRQLAAVGGVWLLSFLVVFANVTLFDLLTRRAGWERRVGFASLGLMLAAMSGQFLLARSPDEGPPFRAIAVQQHRDHYQRGDFSDLGFDLSYLPLLRAAMEQDASIIVLPESVAIGAALLDGSVSLTKPASFTHPLAKWDQQMTALIAGRDLTLLAGIDTVENAKDHNSLVAWSASGPIGWYHKRRPVPFAEYIPGVFRSLPGLGQGATQYDMGEGAQLIRTKVAVVGPFICQEVLMPSVLRESVLAGATLLVSGGNDGVFSDPALRAVNADAAQLRAVESGRYVVRAMKTGISAIIDPHGNELARSNAEEPSVIIEAVHARSSLTLFMRFGNWVVALAALLLLTAGRYYRRC